MKDFGSEVKICAEKNCENEPVYFVLLRVFPKGFKNAPPANLLMSLPFCDQHSNNLKVENFLTDAGWKTIEKAFESAGKAEPDRSKTQVTVWKISDVREGKLPE